MSRLSRRALFALPLVAPLAVVAVVKAPAAPLIDGGPLETLNELAASLKEWKPAAQFTEEHWARITADIGKEIADAIARTEPSARNLAATLGIPYEEPHVWTDADVAMTLGVDIQRDGVAVSAMAVRT